MSAPSAQADRVGPGLIDCDVHNTPPSVEALFPYLNDQWRDYITERGLKEKGFEPNYYPRGAPLSARPDSMPASHNPPGSELDFVRRQVLDSQDAQIAVLNCLYGVHPMHNEHFAAAMARALNDWIQNEWLEADSRLRASIVVPWQDPRLAAAEIERIGTDDRFVQVLMTVRSDMPLGKSHYWPIYEAAERHDLPVGVHAFGSFAHPNTPAGWSSTYLEDYISQSQAFHAQVVSLVCQGVFASFPRLRVVLIESGVTWLPPFMWRFDKDWKALRQDTPWVSTLPSSIIRDHVYLTTQPFDVPSDPTSLYEVLDQIGSDGMLLFASDYPHWHAGEDDVLAKLTPELRHKILYDNARELYGITQR